MRLKKTLCTLIGASLLGAGAVAGWKARENTLYSFNPPKPDAYYHSQTRIEVRGGFATIYTSTESEKIIPVESFLKKPEKIQVYRK